MSLVSVVIPTYNRSYLIRTAVKSIFDQTFQDLEVIVVDDGSKDDTAEVVADLTRKHQRVRYFRCRHNLGAQRARNLGVREANGKWIAFLDSDDQWLPDSLESRLSLAEDQNLKVVHSECFVIYSGDEMSQLHVPPLTGKIYRSLLSAPGPVFPALLVAKEALRRIGYLDENVISWQEWDTSIRLARHFAFGFVAKPTFIYDCRGKDNISKDTLRDAAGYEQVVLKHLWPILLHMGPLVLSRHFHFAASKYKLAGNPSGVRRCIILKRVFCPFRPRSVLRSAFSILHTSSKKGSHP
jgi:glycosyltransferase involved in cell wall biosynthesis